MLAVPSSFKHFQFNFRFKALFFFSGQDWDISILEDSSLDFGMFNFGYLVDHRPAISRLLAGYKPANSRLQVL